jgi:hypothetical protein
MVRIEGKYKDLYKEVIWVKILSILKYLVEERIVSFLSSLVILSLLN